MNLGIPGDIGTSTQWSIFAQDSHLEPKLAVVKICIYPFLCHIPCTLHAIPFDNGQPVICASLCSHRCFHELQLPWKVWYALANSSTCEYQCQNITWILRYSRRVMPCGAGGVGTFWAAASKIVGGETLEMQMTLGVEFFCFFLPWLIKHPHQHASSLSIELKWNEMLNRMFLANKSEYHMKYYVWWIWNRSVITGYRKLCIPVIATESRKMPVKFKKHCYIT